MTTIKTEGFQMPGRPMMNPRPDFRRPFSDGSMTIDTNDLAALANVQPHDWMNFYHAEQPVESQFGKAPRPKQRKLSMNEIRPRGKAPSRAMSFSHPEPEYFASSWDSVPSLMPGSMQSFAEEAIMDSPITPVHILSDDEQKKQRRRECHNQVEKRRREHINAKIEELGLLLPPQYQVDLEEPILDKKRRNKLKDAGPCKGRVLTQSVQYIHDLRHITQAQANRIQQLESWLVASGFNPGIQPMPMVEPEPLLPYQPMNFEQRSSSASSSSYPNPSDPSPSPKRHQVRRESEVELQMSMGGMDLDMFGRRDEVRW